jgi:hypothetical protein
MNEANELLSQRLAKLANKALDDAEHRYVDPVVLVQKKNDLLKCIIRERIIAAQLWPGDEQGPNPVLNSDPTEGRVVAIIYVDSDTKERNVIYHEGSNFA